MIACFHCGLPVLAPGRHRLAIDGAAQELCCGGCQAATSAIIGAGLAAFYTQRTSPTPTATSRTSGSLVTYDRPDVQASFVRPLVSGEREAALVFEQLECPACAWLNAARMEAVPGVSAAHVDYTTRRARVTWDPVRVQLSTIVAAIESIGYRAQPYTAATAEALRRAIERRELLRLFVAGFAMMQVMMFAVPLYLADGEDMTPDIEQLLRWAALLLTVPVVAWSALPFLQGALRDLRAYRLGMDVPVTLGIFIAFGASVRATLTGQGEVWFDSVTMFVFFLLAARWIARRMRHRAARAIEDLARIRPATAWRYRDVEANPALDATLLDDATLEEVAVQSLQIAQAVLVRSGDATPADGTVLRGFGAFDESALTGESIAQSKRPGDAVLAGTVNRGAPVVLRLDRVGADTWLAGIERMIERASAARPTRERLTDRYASVFVAVILALAAFTGLAWAIIEPARAVSAMVAVLIVTCPCALALATPVVLATASARLARQGVLIAAPDALERLARVDHVAFDKTGSLSTGVWTLVATQAAVEAPTEAATERASKAARRHGLDWLQVAASLEVTARHPAAEALRRAAQARGLALLPAEALRELTGRGVEGMVEGVRYRLGKRDFACAELAVAIESVSTPDAGATVWLADERGVRASFRFDDPLRSDAPATVHDLRAAGIGVSILSGDAQPVVDRVAQALAITEARGDLLPQDKLDRVAALQAHGAIVAMVGDGLNDGPVLACADVGFAVAGAAPLAQLTADLVLIRDDLRILNAAIQVARHARIIMAQNLAWALAYNLAAVPAAALGLVPPWLAGLGMAASSLAVVANAARLVR
ncbi:MAG: heavy metal translocating P-type ATPase [Burkholderiales bacterium]